MHKFLYLTKVEWVSAWIFGGVIPLSLASKYKRMDRDGIYTPDENLVHDSIVDLRSLSPFVVFGDSPNIEDFNASNNFANGVRMPDVKNASLYIEDGLIQSFCNVFDLNVMRRFEKKACVRIFDIDKLREVLDKGLGSRAMHGDCRYTKDHQRGHFLKSVEDSWQCEYRFYWAGREERLIKLPAGIAEVVWVG